eukprot:443815-Pyramimonas_sp.AAC.1
MRITTHEADALPVNGKDGQRKDKLDSTANEGWKTASKADARTSMDNGIHDVIKYNVQAICPDIAPHDEPSRLPPRGTQQHHP